MARPTAIADLAYKAAELGLRVVPLRPMGKVPWIENWQNDASSEPEQVDDWFRQRPQSNYGICTGYDGLFVIDLDGQEAIDWWRDQGYAPGAEVMTPNGGMHVYYRSFDIEVQTNSKKLHPKVDVRGVGGQAAGPGSMLPTGTYKGTLEAIANAPEAPPELIAIIPEKQSYTQIEYTGEQVEEASEKERSSLAWIVQRLQALPEKWHEGAGWHAAVFESAAWLSRMVNSGAYATTEDSAVTLLLTYTPVYPEDGWGPEKILEQWESARKVTTGQFAEPPSDDEEVPRLLPLLKAQEGAPEYTSKGGQFMDLIWTDASSDTDGARWDRRRQILLESFRGGLDMQHAFSLVAGCVAAETVIRQHDGRLVLFKEAKKAYREFLQEQASGVAAVEAGAVPSLAPVTPLFAAEEPIELLIDSERRDLKTETYRWWGTAYLEWVQGSVKLANMPYHRLHVWIILSTVLGMLGYIPREGKRLGVNLWGIIIGESSTGKTEALDKAESVIDAFFKDESPNLGADATTEALHDALIARDGQPSLQVIDEAHGLLGELSGTKGFRGDLITRWTEFYEGKVRASLRSTKKEISGKSATTSFSLLLQGTSAKMAKAMNTALWESGFLVRSLFVIGENIEPSEDDLDVRLIEGDADAAYNGMPNEWARAWVKNRDRLELEGAFPLKMEYEPAALARLNAAMRKMRAVLKSRPNQVALKPYAARFPNQVLKMSALVALSEAQKLVTERHVLIALEASEEFLRSAVAMAKLTTDSDFAQQVDAIEKLVAEKGGKWELSKVYRSMDAPVFEVNRWIDQLIAEQRVVKRQDGLGAPWVLAIAHDVERQAA
ncbi:bifunctional DNA primase/polymerase [Pseudolysinimonas sp.]|uniref:bifunctional DNA primase/polymerase n=1 Tax=Pseudolysinimonas sp. TaxID=2680009 RepID=UPI003F7F74F2